MEVVVIVILDIPNDTAIRTLGTPNSVVISKLQLPLAVIYTLVTSIAFVM